jgi:hypothetical protein
MANRKTNSKSLSKSPEEPLSHWARIALSLTLVPLIGGLVLIGAWALDIQLTPDLDSQAWVGLLFMLLSFILSNLIQKRWWLFAGWLLVGISDFIFLTWVNLWAQVLAGIIGVIGAIILLFEFYRRIGENAEQKSS